MGEVETQICPKIASFEKNAKRKVKVEQLFTKTKHLVDSNHNLMLTSGRLQQKWSFFSNNLNCYFVLPIVATTWLTCVLSRMS